MVFRVLSIIWLGTPIAILGVFLNLVLIVSLLHQYIHYAI